MGKFELESDLDVFGFQVKSFPAGIGEAFDSLLKTILGGFDRPYYGISRMTSNGMEYLAAAIEKFEGEAEKYNYKRYKVEKGEYLTETVKDWRKKTGTINDVFRKMMQDDRVDKTKPCVEWYKNDDEMLCMVRTLKK